jgi:excisionase family DNA binding protein
MGSPVCSPLADSSVDTAVGRSDDAGTGLPQVLTVDELAALLRIDRKTVYSAIRAGEIPGVRQLGRTIRIHRGTVLAWLAQGQGRVSRSKRFR